MLQFAPNTIKEYLLQNGFAQAALTLDALSIAGAQEWQICTIQSTLQFFKDAGLAINDQLLRKGLKQLIGLGVLGVNSLKNSRRGRPSLVYRLPSWEAVAAVLGLILHEKENHHSVEPSHFVSVRAYRAGLHRSYIMANQKKLISRAFLGQRLGVSARSTYNYEQRTDIIAKPQYETRLLDSTAILKLPERKKSSKFFLLITYQREMTEAEKDQFFAWVSPDARKSMHPMIEDRKKLPLIRYLALRERRLGRSVFLAWQTENSYEIA